MRHLIAPAFLLLALTIPTAVQASPDAVVRDCAEDGSVDGKHSDADKRAALKQIPADLDEYSDCRAAISGSIGAGGPKAGSASKKGDSGGGVAAGSGGGTPTINADTNGDGKVSAAEKAAAGKTDLALKQDKQRKDTEGALGDRSTDPTKVSAVDASETSNGLPAPVIASLVALALLALVAGLFFLARRNPGFAQALRRVPLPGVSRR